MILDRYVIRAWITIGGWRILITRSIVAGTINHWLEHVQAQATCCQNMYFMVKN